MFISYKFVNMAAALSIMLYICTVLLNNKAIV